MAKLEAGKRKMRKMRKNCVSLKTGNTVNFQKMQRRTLKKGEKRKKETRGKASASEQMR